MEGGGGKSILFSLFYILFCRLLFLRDLYFESPNLHVCVLIFIIIVNVDLFIYVANFPVDKSSIKEAFMTQPLSEAFQNLFLVKNK